jgi:hypothetical protein
MRPIGGRVRKHMRVKVEIAMWEGLVAKAKLRSSLEDRVRLVKLPILMYSSHDYVHAILSDHSGLSRVPIGSRYYHYIWAFVCYAMLKPHKNA